MNMQVIGFLNKLANSLLIKEDSLYMFYHAYHRSVDSPQPFLGNIKSFKILS